LRSLFETNRLFVFHMSAVTPHKLHMVWMWRHCHKQWTVELTNLTDHVKFTSMIIHYFHTSEKSGFSLQNIRIFSCHKISR